MALTKVTGELVDIGDLDISNVGSIQLDSIAGDADTNTTIAFPGSDVITMSTGGTEALRVDSSGRLFVGQTASSGVRSTNPEVQVSGTDLSTSSLALHRYQANAYGPYLHFAKSRNGTVGSHTIVQDGDVVGALGFYPSDGNDFVSHCAEIVVEVDGTPGSDDVPGRIIFKTTADGSASSTERMRITSAGDVGIGATPATAAGISRYLHIDGGDPGIVLKDSTANDVAEIYNAGGKFIIYGGSGGTNADVATFDLPNKRLGIGTTSPSTKLHLEDSSANSIVQLTWKNDARDWRLGVHGGVSDSLVLYDNTASATRMVVNSSGNVGIGTTSPSQLLHVSSTGSAGILLEADSDNANEDHVGEIQITQDGGATYHKLGTNNDNHAYINVSEALIIERQGTEKIRMDNAGKLFIGDSTFGGTAARFAVEVPASGAGCLIRVDSAANANETLLQFQDAAGQALGSITGNPSSNTAAYGTSSDYRLKENVSYTWDATTRLKQLKPARFNWKSQDASTVQDGFLAHEVSAIVPSAVVGAKDAKDSDDNPIYQQIDHSKLVPLLVKTIQELEARIATLEG